MFHPAFRGVADTTTSPAAGSTLGTNGNAMEIDQITSLVSIFSFGQHIMAAAAAANSTNNSSATASSSSVGSEVQPVDSRTAVPASGQDGAGGGSVEETAKKESSEDSDSESDTSSDSGHSSDDHDNAKEDEAQTATATEPSTTSSSCSSSNATAVPSPEAPPVVEVASL